MNELGFVYISLEPVSPLEVTRFFLDATMVLPSMCFRVCFRVCSVCSVLFMWLRICWKLRLALVMMTHRNDDPPRNIPWIASIPRFPVIRSEYPLKGREELFCHVMTATDDWVLGWGWLQYNASNVSRSLNLPWQLLLVAIQFMCPYCCSQIELCSRRWVVPAQTWDASQFCFIWGLMSQCLTVTLAFRFFSVRRSLTVTVLSAASWSGYSSQTVVIFSFVRFQFFQSDPTARVCYGWIGWIVRSKKCCVKSETVDRQAVVDVLEDVMQIWLVHWDAESVQWPISGSLYFFSTSNIVVRMWSPVTPDVEIRIITFCVREIKWVRFLLHRHVLCEPEEYVPECDVCWFENRHLTYKKLEFNSAYNTGAIHAILEGSEVLTFGYLFECPVIESGK